MTNYEIVSVVSAALLSGLVLQNNGVSAGNGRVIDWRTIRCGSELGQGLCAYDSAALFVDLIGSSAALEAVRAQVPA